MWNYPMTEPQESLSDFWRQKRSTDLPEELANVLDSARGYVGFFGSDFTVDWGKVSIADPTRKRVELDFSELVGKTPPFDGKDIDMVMGTAIHECGHIKWSYPPEKVREFYAKKHGHYGARISRHYGYSSVYLNHEEEQEAKELKTVANVIEDFYVENKISEKYPTLGAYLREARKLASKAELPHNLLYDITTDNPSFDSLITMWGAIALIDKTIPDNASKTSKKLLNKLINYTIQTTKAKPNKRLQISYQIWDELKALDRASEREQERQIKQQAESEGKGEQEQQASTESKAPPKEEEETEETKGEKPKTTEEEGGEEREAKEETGSEESETTTDTEVDTEEKDKGEDKLPEEDLDEPYQSHDKLRDSYSINLDHKESISQDLKDAVDLYLERKPENITKQVNQMLGGAGGKEIVMELAGSDSAVANKLFKDTRRVAQKVSKLFMYDKKLRTRYRRGLQEGSVDTRRLGKAGASDYKLFQRKEVLTAPNLAVGILVDASGSMNYQYIEPALKMAMALKTALSMIEGIDLMVTAYNTDIPRRHRYDYGGDRHTTLHRIYDRRTGEFRPDVKAAGGTPSGYAISGMVSQMGRYLIGKDKMIIHLTDGAPNSYEEVTQAVNYCKEHKIEVMTLTLCRFDKEVTEAYRGLVEHLDNIDKLPDAVASLLKKRLQKRMMRIK